MITFTQIENWSKQTWIDTFKSARNKGCLSSSEKKNLWLRLSDLRYHQDYSNFSSIFVTGSVSQGWKDLNSSGPLFQESLEAVFSLYPGDWSIAEYLIHYYRECLNQGLELDRMDLGRSIRNLPSFFREYLLEQALLKAGYDVEIPTASVNASMHVDLILKLGDETIMIWNYLNSTKALNMVAYKIEKRGKIYSGLNLLAPITPKKDTEDYYNWYIPSNKYICNLIACASSTPESMSDITADLNNPSTFSTFRLFMG